MGKLGLYIKEVNEKTTQNNQYEVLTSSQGGIVSQEDYFNKQVASTDNTGYKVIRKGQFTYRSMSDTGRFYINRLTNREVGIVSPAYPVFEILSDRITSDYLSLFFQSEHFQSQISDKASGSTRLALRYSKLENVEINIIAKEKQEKIVRNIDLIKKVIEAEEREQSILDELIKSRFNELFGDPLLNEYGFEIKELSKLAPFNSVKNAIVVNNNTWLLNLDMIESDTGRIIEKIRTSEIGDSTIEFDTTCVLYSKLRPYLNKVVIPDENGIGTSELISMRCDSKIITREYLAYSLRHKSFVNYINSKTGGAKMPRTNMNDLRSFKMPIPPMELQEGFSSFVNQIDKLKFSRLVENSVIFNRKIGGVCA